MSKNIFHAYDIRGIYPTELNYDIAYRIAHAYFEEVPGQRYVIAYDMRDASQELFKAFAAAADALGKELDSLGMTTTDMLYFALGKFDYDGGIALTASHNSQEWGGIKLMAKGVLPVEIANIKQKFETQIFPDLRTPEIGTPKFHTKDYTDEYAEHVLGFVDRAAIKQFNIVIDAGNGMGGINARQVLTRLPQLHITEMYFEPHAAFPHHEANPAIAANTKELVAAVKSNGASLGVAFDGDGDRCFFIDERGQYVPAYYIAALLTKHMLQKEPGAGIVSDARNVRAIEHEIRTHQGRGIITKVGHSYYKQAMREHNALFGGESSGHFYFRQNFFADNGLIPVVLILELLSKEGKKLSELISPYRKKFLSSGEQNFKLREYVSPADVITRLKTQYSEGDISEGDGLTVTFEGWRMNVRMSNTEQMLRINIEATTEVQLDEVLVKINEELADMAELDPERVLKINELEDRFDEVMSNLWYTWNPHHILPVVDVYGDGWRQNPPPGKFKSDYAQKRYADILEAKAWEIKENRRLMKAYLADDRTWFTRHCREIGQECFAELQEHPVAYFCMEFGLVDWLQIYSGGLGILAGDFLKQASDMGVPLVGVGIFYHQGYFHQTFDDSGYQQESYLHQNPEEYPFELITDKDDKPLEISIEIVDHEVWVRGWRLAVGRTNLILLDTNIERNEKWEDRMITAHLYGGDSDTRIRQEILLGIGGSRFINAMGIKPSLYHMNEGHSGFLVLEQARRYIEHDGLTFTEAISKISQHLLFTNHTLKQAGNDIFEPELMQKYFHTYLDNLHTNIDEVFNLGKDDKYAKGNFSMTMLGMRYAAKSNAVSKLHGQAAKNLWPDHDLIPITNGVHMPTWVATEIHELLDKYVGEGWHNPANMTNYEKILEIPDAELWVAHTKRKQKLISSLNNQLGFTLNPSYLTLAWARRLASYKRPDLIMKDIDKLGEIVCNSSMPVQIILAGKAHPKDSLGKELLQQMHRKLEENQFKNRIVLIPGYNWQLARRMVSGADVWLNTPYRYEEASGTSGMKAAANGVLQLTTLDGWTDEVDWQEKGWVIAEEDSATSLYQQIESNIAPLFYSDTNESTETWVTRMKKTMIAVIYNYSSERMMKDYLQKLYLPLLSEKSSGKLS